MKEKTIFIIVAIVFSLYIVICIINQNLFYWKGWTQPVGSYWTLMDAASTLKAKSDYLDTFLTELNKLQLAEYGALVFKTPSNNVKQNIKILKTLQERLHKLQNIDETTFAYTTAINQITAQESEIGITGNSLIMAWAIKTNIWMSYTLMIWFWCIIGIAYFIFWIIFLGKALCW